MRMVKAFFCLFSSLALHVAVVAATLWVIGNEWTPPLLRGVVYEVDLVTVAPVRPAPDMDADVDAVSEPPSEPRPAPRRVVAATPPPAPPVIPPATPPSPAPREPVPSPPSVSASRPEPNVSAPPPASVPKSAVPVAAPAPPAAPPAVEAEAKPLPGVFRDEEGTVHVGGLRGFAGFADTFALERCGADTFVPEDYFGHYRMGGERFVSIIDGRAGFGKFLLYDSKTGLFRALRRDAEMVFAYGPHFAAEEPVEGVVTILPKKDRYHNEYIRKPAQLMWMPEHPPMEYGTRIDFDERPVTFESDGVRLAGVVVRRPDVEAHSAVVLLTCRDCVAREVTLSMARVLSLRGVVVLVYDGRGCGESGIVSGPLGMRERVDDARAALRHACEVTGFPDDRVGLWGDGAGVECALRAAWGGGAGFVVCSLREGDAVPSALLAELAGPSGLRVSSLWLVSGADARRHWRSVARQAARLATPGRVVFVERYAARPEEPDAPGLVPLPLVLGREFAQWMRSR
ncbi:hypothetical protein GGQ74_002415 [Desulfobaculum xiamenense]|uniref:Alpha/beta hydrolase family protein n=1 Tax=Desulfobaculum xiamenense TaxID=995050 RepID=A0A846QQG6_9BACT|nr:hypothetical protein [Desulfobaculum xiamenense]NJB68742.1 hypothetical protein [Desulfobaculum xiamenense]